jgi:hypothetical protein
MLIKAIRSKFHEIIYVAGIVLRTTLPKKINAYAQVRTRPEFEDILASEKVGVVRIFLEV